MTGQHPLDKLSAAVDGELDHDSRDRVLSHLVCCDSCRAEVEAQRRLKGRLAALPEPEPPSDLMQRLMGVPSFAPEPREEVRPVVTPVVAPTLSPQRSVFPAGRPAAARTSSSRPAPRATRSRRRAGVLGAAGSAAALASLLGTAFVLGDPARADEQAPALQPPMSSFSADHAATVGTNPLVDPVALFSAPSGAGYAGLGPTLQPAGTTGR